MSHHSFNHKVEVEFATFAEYQMASLVASRLHSWLNDKELSQWSSDGLSIMISTRGKRTTMYLCSSRLSKLSEVQIRIVQAMAQTYAAILLPFFPKVTAHKTYFKIVK